MKRLGLVILFVFPVLSYTSAQTFQAGFYAGAVASDIPGTDNIDNDVDYEHLGFTVAGTVSTRISPKTRLQMEIRFSQRGAQQKPAIDTTYLPNGNIGSIGYNNYFNLTLNYIDVVIGVKHAIHFNLRNAATDRYGIEAGIGIGSLVGYSYEVQSVSYNVNLNSFDLSPYVGFYYNVTPHFYLEARYSNSITSVIKHDNSNPGDFYSIYYSTWDAGHNVAFNLTFGFIFGGSANQPGGGSAPAPSQSDNN